ncbi:MAG: hypothetical protein AABX01_02720, partial [Candidatus Micrarchaeota archaeon]
AFHHISQAHTTKADIILAACIRMALNIAHAKHVKLPAVEGETRLLVNPERKNLITRAGKANRYWLSLIEQIGQMKDI